ncbi:MAG TPA: hypothetical protein O0X27_04615 [Methanocorpusculum sp.]|nr:hypothetical protein [Methanocorpusculum sp.]
MTECSDDDFRRVRKFGMIAFIVAVAGFVLSIGTYIVFFICGKALGMIPDMPALRLTMLILTAVVLLAGFLLEGISSLKEAQQKWQLMLGMFLWVMGAVFCAIMFTGAFS